ncbi:MAG: hypothetical protein ACOC2J_04445 [bacterium]
MKENLMNDNYKGDNIPVIGGIILVFFTIIIYFVLHQMRFINREFLDINIFIIPIIGMMGLLDDMVGDKESQGLRGHLSSLFKGRLTTGIFKVIITIILSTIVSIQESEHIIYLLVINSAIIILMTNFLNLLDLRPGRSIKVFLIISFILISLDINNILYFLPFFIVFLIYLPYELRGRVMLGDSGANLLGAVLGYNTIILINGLPMKLFIMVILFFFNIISEKISFTEVISNNRVLRWIDRIGR